eukprot:4687369-Amphidinium_carterae.1
MAPSYKQHLLTCSVLRTLAGSTITATHHSACWYMWTGGSPTVLTLRIFANDTCWRRQVLRLFDAAALRGHWIESSWYS